MPVPKLRATTAPSQTAMGKKRNKYPSEIGLFPTMCYDTRAKCSLRALEQRCLLQGEEGNASPHPIFLSLRGNSQPSRFHSLVQVFKTPGWVEGKGQTTWAARSPWARALESNTTRKSLSSSPVGLLGLADTSATVRGSCHPAHISWWDKGSSRNTNSTVKTNTVRKPNPESSFCSLLEPWKTGRQDCPHYIS